MLLACYALFRYFVDASSLAWISAILNKTQRTNNTIETQSIINTSSGHCENLKIKKIVLPLLNEIITCPSVVECLETP